MEQFKRILASLSAGQKIITVAVALLVLGGIYSLSNWRKEADFKPLYTGLAAEDSAAVVAKLKESGADYRLSASGDSVLVPSAKLAEMRLELAAAGLPKTGRIGYELFDKTNLGATEFVEHINYRRALEGELERSVMALSEVEQARVHVTFPKDSVFLESREPAKASVMVKIRPGARISPRNVVAIAHLVGSAVEGLTPDSVSILDMQGNLLSRPVAASPEEAASEAGLDHRQKVERDILQKISASLDPLLGHERYRAGVWAECEINSGEQSEETVDPARSVMVSSQKTEESTGSNASSGVPGVASNLPRPTSKPGGSGNSTTRRTENVVYQSSRITRNMKLPQGAIKRISVSLLLDQHARWEGAGKAARKVITPLTPEVMKTVKDVVSAVVGFNQERGDQITVESLPFEDTVNQQAPEVPGTAPKGTEAPVKWNDWKHQPLLIPVSVAVGLMVLGGIAFMVMRKKKVPAGAAPDVEMQRTLPARSANPSLDAANMAEQIETQMAEREAEQQRSDLAALASIKMPLVRTKKTEVLAKQLREGSKKDASPAGLVLQAWISDKG
ncbi:MAG: flagellar basal-body MS-ring/collar protein FliF [Candidatus Solibacter sp.]